ncbi:MAG: 50S ribosomal protein L32 [Candidatus Marinimicrobia bacterium]|nr:50S ribosomal protein L32 [Candidatus Neomarinimicrobiota bacterium]
MTIRMRHTKSHTGNRRSHHRLKKAGLSSCEKCGESKLLHAVCKNCGFYGKRQVVDVLKKLTKKEKKNKEKELTEQEKQKGLSAEDLSKKS